MTIEEAKEIFLNRGYIQVKGGRIYDGDKWRESIVVISKWLEQEPCEDVISRQAVLEGKVIHQSCDGVEIINSYAVPVEYIEQLPSIQPKPKTEWIPVSERLPKEGKTVLVCYQTQGGVAQSVCEWFEMRNGGIVWSTLCGEKPIAWMPLPEPYEPADSEKEQ